MIYNTERPHQALPGRITPLQAWEATPKADPPRPRPDTAQQPLPQRASAATPRGRAVDEVRVARIHINGTVKARGTWFQTSSTLAGQTTYVVYEQDTVLFFDAVGTLIIEHPWPEPGVRYVGNGKPRGPRPKTL